MTHADKVVAALPSVARAELEGRLPAWLEPRWFCGLEEALRAGADAQVGWFDMDDRRAMAAAIVNATRMRWLNSMYAGVDGLPLGMLEQRGVVFTNGAGLNAVTIAEFVVMGMLTIAKGYREIVRAQERREWLTDAPGKRELAGSRALLIGHGAIGSLVHERLAAFGVEVVVARRTPERGSKCLGPDEWRSRLGLFDWVVLTVPATAETRSMVGEAEIAAMKPSAVLVNVGRASVVDQDALVRALEQRRIAAAFLDVTDPEPLPADHRLWSLDNAHVTMHLSGRSQTGMLARAADRFIENLALYRGGQPLRHQVDLALGY
jgi:phosphoglycerate dehydrogenase-like enzyme